jgi:hypothetical protein
VDDYRDYWVEYRAGDYYRSLDGRLDRPESGRNLLPGVGSAGNLWRWWGRFGVTVVSMVFFSMVDGWMLEGVIGPGWPVPVKASVWLIVLGAGTAGSIFLWVGAASGVFDWLERIPAWVPIGVSGVAGVALFVLLPTVGLWPVSSGWLHLGHVPGVSASSGIVSRAGASSSGPDAMMVWTAVGAVGSLLAGLAALAGVIVGKSGASR